ncbi:MAG: hypothetical protein ABI847_03715, partial [Anaerolineales bacterium]
MRANRLFNAVLAAVLAASLLLSSAGSGAASSTEAPAAGQGGGRSMAAYTRVQAQFGTVFGRTVRGLRPGSQPAFFDPHDPAARANPPAIMAGVTGPQKVLVLRVYFADYPNASRYTQTEVEGFFDELDNLWQNSSYDN